MLVTHEGLTKELYQWIKQNPNIRTRISSGWCIQCAVSNKPNETCTHHREKGRVLRYGEVYNSLRDWAGNDIDKESLYGRRYVNGWCDYCILSVESHLDDEHECKNKLNPRIYRKSTGGPSYAAWESMVSRCDNENDIQFKHFGGKGIIYCADWEDFQVFHLDIGYKITYGKSLERKDQSGHFDRHNCHIVDKVGQARRNSILITAKGKTQNITAWANETGIPQARLRSRLNYGWCDECCISEDSCVHRVKGVRAKK